MKNMFFVLAMVFCGCAQAPDDVGSAASALVPGEQIVYDLRHPVPQSQLMDLGDPADFGGEVLEGNPRISARFDYLSGPISAGVFQVTRGKLRVFYPFTEHATILWGRVTVTDEAGRAHTYGPGDSYLMPQGSLVLVEVHSLFLQKSFLNIVQ